MKKRNLVFVTGLMFSGAMTMSQSLSPQLVSSAGDTYKNTSFQLDWSIGEPLIETYTGPQIILTQGFHQGTYIITAIDEALGEKCNITVHPNPTSDFITIQVESEQFKSLQYTITDLSGNVLQIQSFTRNLIFLDFSGLTAGTYFLTITDNKLIVKLFKIIKN